MANERILRSQKNTSSVKGHTNIASKSTTKTTTSARSSISSSDSSTHSRISEVNKASTCRLSSSTIKSPAIPATVTSQDKIKEFEARLVSLESSSSALVNENAELKRLITELAADFTVLKAQNLDLTAQLQSRHNFQSDQHRLAIVNNDSTEQQEINENIVIRGPEVSETTSESDLLVIYEGLRNHLGVLDVPELDPISVSVIASSSDKKPSYRPIVVKLSSVEAKRKLLQVRRIKKDIYTSDIGINNKPRRPLLVSEQLTKSNQELLYQARSLRGENGFKFVWSSNGQILARQKQNSKVIRIFDTAHVNRLKHEINQQEYGRRSSGTIV